MSARTLVLSLLLLPILATAALAGPAEDEVQRAQVWHDLKLTEVTSAQRANRDATDALKLAQQRLDEAQKAFQAAQQRQQQAQQRQAAAEQAEKDAQQRLDQAWSVLDAQRKSAGS